MSAVVVAAHSKNNDIKQTFANIRLTQLAYHTVDRLMMQAYGHRST